MSSNGDIESGSSAPDLLDLDIAEVRQKIKSYSFSKDSFDH